MSPAMSACRRLTHPCRHLYPSVLAHTPTHSPSLSPYLPTSLPLPLFLALQPCQRRVHSVFLRGSTLSKCTSWQGANSKIKKKYSIQRLDIGNVFCRPLTVFFFLIWVRRYPAVALMLATDSEVYWSMYLPKPLPMN